MATLESRVKHLELIYGNLSKVVSRVVEVMNERFDAIDERFDALHRLIEKVQRDSDFRLDAILEHLDRSVVAPRGTVLRVRERNARPIMTGLDRMRVGRHRRRVVF